MKITNVSLRKLNSKGSIKATAEVVLDNEFVIHNIRLIENSTGKLFVAMPSRQTQNGEYKDIAHPIKAETRAMFEKAIIDEYNK